jgi:hypothetical protein
MPSGSSSSRDTISRLSFAKDYLFSASLSAFAGVTFHKFWRLDGRRWVQTGIKGECLLELQRIVAGRLAGDKDQVPAMTGHRAWNCEKTMLSQQVVAECLLAGARDTGPQPVRIGNGDWIDDMHRGGVGDDSRRQDMWDRVECAESLVDRDLKDRRRRVDGAVDRPHAFAVPSTADTISAFTAIPCRCISGLVEPPCDQFGTPERNR